MKLNISVTLSAKDVEQLILERVRQETGHHDLTKVDFKIKNVNQGDMRDSWTIQVFDGATISK